MASTLIQLRVRSIEGNWGNFTQESVQRWVDADMEALASRLDEGYEVVAATSIGMASGLGDNRGDVRLQTTLFFLRLSE